MSVRRGQIGLWAAVIALAIAQPCAVRQAAAAAAEERLSGAQKSEIVHAVASAYADQYVFEEKGRHIAEQLRRQAAAGAFAAIGEHKEFAAALTNSIRAVHADRHIEVLPPQPAGLETPRPAAQPSRAERLAWVERLRRRNYDFVRVERLPGNVGLLQLNSFPPPELAADTAAAAMAFLRNSDALIIDLRDNGGGTGDMVRFLASYFFVEPTRLGRTFRRNREPRVSYDMTLTHVPGERLPVIDLYLLTSAKTFSAAEAFAFALVENDRATIVGETTGGGGNAGDYIDVGHGFRAFVPDVHVSSPYNETSWEGRGVVPARQVPPSQALAAAHREAVTKLIAASSDEPRRRALQEVLRQIQK